MKKTLLKAALLISVLCAAFIVRRSLDKKIDQGQDEGVVAQRNSREIDYAEQVADDHPVLCCFYGQFPEAEVILACEEDVTDDGLKDLVVIYRQDNLIRTVVVTNGGESDEHTYSEPIPAPVENQKIQFKNIDKEGAIEIIITGEKKGAVGYAIYRMIDGEPVDLFGEGMDDCC